MKLKWWIGDLLSGLGVRRSLNTRAGSLQVLAFHGVCPDHLKPLNARTMRESDFRSLLEALKVHFNILSMDEFLEGNLDATRLNVLLTFDDGYRNNQTIVLPHCEELEIPFTIFVTNRTQRYLWPDVFDILGNRQESMQELTDRFPELNGQSLRQMKTAITRWKPEAVEELTDLLIHRAGIIREDERVFCELLSDDELKQLSNHPLVNLGNHSANHYSFPQLGASEILEELQLAHERLSKFSNYKKELFAYPFGHYSTATIQALKKAEITRQLVQDGCDFAPEGCTDRLMINPYISLPNLLKAIDRGRY